MIRTLNLSGKPREIGQQHGEQVFDLRPQIQELIQNRVESLDRQGIDLEPFINDVIHNWEVSAYATLEILRGLSEALDLAWNDYFKYTISSYLSSCIRNNQLNDGCTTWAAGEEITLDGSPLLAKNRDYLPEHQLLQCLAHVEPEKGYPYTCLTSAGSPGVYSSGMNVRGLACADTFVASKDIGPGRARYSVMMDVLEKYSTVDDAIMNILYRPHFGDGTITLVDASGDMAAIEITHKFQAVIRYPKNYVISTNHFNASATRTLWHKTEPAHLKGNSVGRRNRVMNALSASRGQVDIPWAQHFMSLGGSEVNAICRGPELDPQSSTISCVIFSPRKAGFSLANGLPSQTEFEWHSVK